LELILLPLLLLG
jgi:hypothetical protein